jgi:hypothetical protein
MGVSSIHQFSTDERLVERNTFAGTHRALFAPRCSIGQSEMFRSLTILFQTHRLPAARTRGRGRVNITSNAGGLNTLATTEFKRFIVDPAHRFHEFKTADHFAATFLR